MSSVFNEALERATNPQMLPPKSPLKTSTSTPAPAPTRAATSPSQTSILFQDTIKETVLTATKTGPAYHCSTRPSTPRPAWPDDRNVCVSGALPPISISTIPIKNPSASLTTSTTLPSEIPIPPFHFRSRTPSSYVPYDAEDQVDWSEPTPPLPGAGTIRRFRDPQAAAAEERSRHFAQQQQRKFEKLVSAGSNALRDAPALPAATDDDVAAEVAARAAAESSVGSESTTRNVPRAADSGLAGEFGSVYIPGQLQSGKASGESCEDGNLFSDVAEDAEETEDDEEEWDAEIAKAEEEVAVESGDEREGLEDHDSFHMGGLSTWAVDVVGRATSGAITHEAMAGSAIAGAATRGDPAAAPYVKHTSTTAARDWAYPPASMPSPTESQLVAAGFEFHSALSDEEQIARFGDKAFRRALREVLPSLSRKQQWYAWRQVSEDSVFDEDMTQGEEGAAPAETLTQGEGEDGGDECGCTCVGNGAECDGDDGTCGRLLNQCRCGDCGDCDEHYRWHHPDGACDVEGEMDEEAKEGRLPKCVCGMGVTSTYQGMPVTPQHGHQAIHNEAEGDDTPDSLWGEEGLRHQTPYRHLALNTDVNGRPSGWTGLFSQGRVVDGEPVSAIREHLDVGHDVPAPTRPRIPGLDLLEPPSTSPSSSPYAGIIRRSVEPETPRRQLHRASTPAFEDRSPTPSPMSHTGASFADVAMTDVPSPTISITTPPPNPRLPLPPPTSSPDPISSPLHAVTAPQTPFRSHSQSPAKVHTPLVAAPQSVKHSGGRRKSAVHGAKVGKATSAAKSRAVSRKVTTAVKHAAEKAATGGPGKVKEAVARIEARVKGQESEGEGGKAEETTPQRRSARLKARLER